MTQQSSRLALACILAIIGGLVIPLAAFVSLVHALALWIAIMLTIGLTAGGIRVRRARTLIGQAALAAILIPASAIGFYWVRWLATWMKDPTNREVMIPMFSGHYAGPTDGYILMGLGALALTAFLASWLLIFLFTAAAAPFSDVCRRVFHFGPEGFNRVNKILTSAAGAVTALLGLLTVLGLNRLA